jgi:hypothetical protein
MRTSLLAALLILLAGVAQAQQPVRLAAAFGPVTLRAPGEERFAAGVSGSVLAEGTALRTGAGARAVLALPGGRAALDPGGHLDIAKADGGALILTRGVLALELREAPSTPIQVATPRGVAAFDEPGRYLLAAGDPAAPVQLIAVAGRARLLVPAGPMTAEPGQAAWIAADGTPRLGPVATTPALLAWLAGEAPPPVAAAPAAPPPPARVASPPPPPAPAPSTTIIVQESQPLFVPVWPVVPRPLPPLRPPPFPPHRPEGGIFLAPPGTPAPGPMVTTPPLQRPGTR